MANKKLECPHCNEIFEFSLDDLSADDIKPLLTKYELERQDHRHKTADDFLDCPGCREWFNKTTQKYTITLKEPAAPPAEPPAETEPARPAIGSIFKKGEET